MEGRPTAAVTPAGIRDGEPGSLHGLLERRGPAVLAFCEAVCTPDAAVHAAAEAFARFRAAVAASDDPGALDPEPLLLSATRHAAASLALPAPTPPRGRVSRRREAEPLCPAVPGLLAQRADDMLPAAELDALSHHLDEHADCRSVEAAFRRAERAFRSPAERRLPAIAEEVILRALIAAAPVLAPGFADGPVTAEQSVDDPWHGDPPEDDEPLTEGPRDEELAHPADTPLQDPEDTAHEDEAADEEDDAFDEDAVYDDEEDEDDLDWAPPSVVATTPEPVVAIASTTAGAPDVPRRDSGGSGTGLARRRRVHVPAVHPGPVFGYVLPGAALVVALIIILAVAGVFGGDGPAPGGSAGYP